jgi:hypothetical protein
MLADVVAFEAVQVAVVSLRPSFSYDLETSFSTDEW